MYLVLEYKDGTQQYERLDENITLDEAKVICKNALEDAPIAYIYPSYQDDRYGLQPATHLDYLHKCESATK